MQRNRAVSRKTAVTQRSLFAQPETSAQQTQALLNQSQASKTNQFVGQYRRKPAAQSQPRSAFGKNRIPGTTEVRQPNSRMVRNAAAAARPARRQTMSLAQMDSFIARNGGVNANTATASACFGGSCGTSGAGRFDGAFDQTLTTSGAAMARGGQIPPEVQQMAVPFRSQRRLQRNDAPTGRAVHPGAQWQRAAGKMPKRTSEKNQMAVLANVSQQQQDEQARNDAQKSEKDKVQAVLEMGVPFKSGGRKTTAGATIVKPKAWRAPPKVVRNGTGLFQPIERQDSHNADAQLVNKAQDWAIGDGADDSQPELQARLSLFGEHIQEIEKKRREMLQKAAPVLDDEPTQFPVSMQKRKNTLGSESHDEEQSEEKIDSKESNEDADKDADANAARENDPETE